MDHPSNSVAMLLAIQQPTEIQRALILIIGLIGLISVCYYTVTSIERCVEDNLVGELLEEPKDAFRERLIEDAILGLQGMDNDQLETLLRNQAAMKKRNKIRG